MKIMLVVPAGEAYRVTEQSSSVTKRAMLRFSVLPVLSVAGATPEAKDSWGEVVAEY